MPGGFTWADAFYGFQEGGQAALTAGWAVAAVAVGCALLVLFVLALGRMATLADRQAGYEARADVRAENLARLYRHEALPYTDDVPFAGRAAWPERKAS